VNSTYPPILDTLGLGRPVQLTRVAGGCIAQAQVAVFSNGAAVFVKCLEDAPGMFECEASGLRALAGTGAIRVPEVLAVDPTALVLEVINEGRKGPGFFETFGRAFADLHTHHGPAFGFPHDNFIGSTIQQNGYHATWDEFFLERRLGFQVRLAAERGHGHDLEKLLERAEPRIRALLNEAAEPPCLLHGDLWSGNFLVDEKGEACLIDPAVYYGHREADLAMTRLFGGFGTDFYDAYQEALPLEPGFSERLEIYQLYHLLNHLNLFGRAYYSQCSGILQRYSA